MREVEQMFSCEVETLRQPNAAALKRLFVACRVSMTFTRRLHGITRVTVVGVGWTLEVEQVGLLDALDLALGGLALRMKTGEPN